MTVKAQRVAESKHKQWEGKEITLQPNFCQDNCYLKQKYLGHYRTMDAVCMPSENVITTSRWFLHRETEEFSNDFLKSWLAI